ncbi:YciI family protein [Actinoplanes sp. NBRC 103695]|uniref:YciI family protein n=1 Tax=Actinoplanes sp. NBRC 103695 TaxID=3032202 RepID=UPI0024A2D1EE|nr:YciI family protein [Actinoplanes sp. NBRC 103695]GLZ01442.1 transcription initiation protein [Actinoplanes sp. NBRC 103695]
MKFMMFVCTDTQPETDEAAVPSIEQWVADTHDKGRAIMGERLADATTATTVRVRGGELLLTDGPFAETTEVICGFDILEVADLDEAIEIARNHPMAYAGRIELRAFDPLDL